MDINLEKIIKSCNQELQELDNSSNAVSAYIGLLQYRKDYLHTIRYYGEGSIEEKSLKDSYLKKNTINFFDKKISSVEEALEALKKTAMSAIKLNEQYCNIIKSYFLNNDLKLTAIRVLSPEQMGKIIPRSKKLLSQFEEEEGDWVFASSTPKEENPYIGRCHGKGMLNLGNNMFYYYDSSLDFKDGRLFIEPNGYIYYIRPDDFSPVTTVKRNRDGLAHFIFDDEWIYPHDISLEKDISNIEEYSDVTFLLRNL